MKKRDTISTIVENLLAVATFVKFTDILRGAVNELSIDDVAEVLDLVGGELNVRVQQLREEAARYLDEDGVEDCVGFEDSEDDEDDEDYGDDVDFDDEDGEIFDNYEYDDDFDEEDEDSFDDDDFDEDFQQKLILINQFESTHARISTLNLLVSFIKKYLPLG